MAIGIRPGGHRAVASHFSAVSAGQPVKAVARPGYKLAAAAGVHLESHQSLWLGSFLWEAIGWHEIANMAPRRKINQSAAYESAALKAQKKLKLAVKKKAWRGERMAVSESKKATKAKSWRRP